MNDDYIYNSKSLLEQFKIFCQENKPENFEIAVEFFSIFGGLNRQVNCKKDLQSQIKIHILKRYKYIRNDISKITKGNEEAHKMLSCIALSDRRTNSSFKRCKTSFDKGIDIVDEQCDLGMLKLEKSLQGFTNLELNNDISEKLIFTTPFSHFWFSFVSPIYKGIRDGNFEESLQSLENKKVELISFVYEQLCHEMTKEIYINDEIKQIGRYWDNSSNIIDILAKTKSGKIIAGSCKYTHKKIKKTELNKLKIACKDLGINVDEFVMFNKNSYTSELKSMKSNTLHLYTIKKLECLVNL